MGRPPLLAKVPFGACEIINFEDRVEDLGVTDCNHTVGTGDSNERDETSSRTTAFRALPTFIGTSDDGDGSPVSTETELVVDDSANVSDVDESTIDGNVADTPAFDEPIINGLESDLVANANTNLNTYVEPYAGTELVSNSTLPPTTSHLLRNLFAFVEARNIVSCESSLPGAVKHQRVRSILMDRQTFYNYHHQFMIGPSFLEGFHEAIVSIIARSDGVLMDAYAAALTLWDDKFHKLKTSGEIDASLGSNCLKQLQTVAVANVHDAAAVIMLGQVLWVYHIVLLGTSAYAIIRRSLLLVKEWFPSLLMQPSLYPIIITPILVDTAESLIRREVPVIEFSVNEDAITDRTVGLCTSLLSIQYRICKISHEAKVATLSGSDSFGKPQSGIRNKALIDIEREVREWESIPPVEFFTKYSQHEISSMMLQARVYRLATLLILHRLQYPMGINDEPALRLAMTIAAELECFVQWIPADMRGLAIGLPVLVSTLEADCLSEQVIEYVSPEASKDREYFKKLQGFARLVRAARDNGYTGLWFDLVEGGFHIPVLP